jgi:hypothetical protein
VHVVTGELEFLVPAASPEGRTGDHVPADAGQQPTLAG